MNVLETILQYQNQLITAVTLIFALVGLNYVLDRENMRPPLRRQLEIAAVTTVAVLIGVYLACINGLEGYLDTAFKGLLGLYVVSVLLVFGQINPVTKPLIDKLLKFLDKDGNGQIDKLEE
ncbi:hypothetical protein [Paraglaciecola chathamensis]|uniref:hypothetical protein n=1 Tax=Paraglaciecola chathamensis TaxID=368405 RepID=UPI00363D33F5